jgi:carboxymethylenebutenolidase
VNQLQKYLAEEVAEDLSDGIISRREAMRRLGLLGMSATTAMALLASLAVPAEALDDPATEPRLAPRRGVPTTWAPITTEPITFAGPRSPLLAAWQARRSRAVVFS